jgi:DNA-binding transcriptional ArsR family regulator
MIQLALVIKNRADKIKIEINMKRLTVIFRALANINRLKIIKLLVDGRKMSVSDIAQELGISLKATSNHLALLKNLDVLEARGTAGHVFYSFNRQLPKDFQE